MIKKLLFAATAFAAISFGANAQETISFESSEGFALGDINGQNGWSATNLPEDPDNPTFTINDGMFSDGSYSFYSEGTNLQYTSGGQIALLGIYSPTDIEFTSEEFEISVDFYFTEPTTAGNGSDVHFLAQSNAEQFLTSRVVFSFDNNVYLLNGGQSYEEVGTFEFETWYTLRIVYDFVEAEIDYYLNDVLLFEGDVWTDATTVDQLVFLFDNYESGYYVDNIVLNDGPASTENFDKLGLNVFPNPVNDIVNITSPEANIEAITITDLNGRTVKSFNFTNVAETTVDASDLSSGIYLLNITANGTVATQKIVKK